MTRTPPIHGETWFNTGPLSPEDLVGKVVLVDFFTYSCVNCLRTIPYLEAWWEKYGSREDFALVGVHAPEFEFEKNPDNVEAALKDLGITWPVVLDNEKEIWNAFANQFWPAKYLIDKNGYIIYQHFGEGSYEETEHEIQQALGLKEKKVSQQAQEEHEHGNVCFSPTPETYCGYQRGEIANREGFREESIFSYEKPRRIEDGTIGLEGKFLAVGEYVESRERGATLHLRFHATEVNLVLHPDPEKEETTVRVFLNDKEIPASKKGDDLAEQGVMTITEPKMYNLIRSSDQVQGVISIQAEENDFQAYAFTFSGCEHSE